MSELLFRPDGIRLCPTASATPTPGWVWIRDGRVAAISPTRPAAASPHATRLTGGWLIEPLADAHVHLFLCGALDPGERAATAALPREAALERVLNRLEAYRRHGVAAVRDGGDPHGLALAAADIANREPGRYAAVLAAGEPIYRRGRYGTFLGAGVEDLAAATALLDANRRRGASHVKILATGINSLERAGQVGGRQFSRTELEQLVAAAQQRGLPTMVHANGPLDAVLAAVPTSVEHGFWVEAEDIQRMAADGTRWVPTLAAWAELAALPGLGRSQLQVVAATDARHRREVRAATAAGVAVTAGSDAGTPGVRHVGGLVGEIARLAAEMGPQATLAAATWQARRLCEEESGTRYGGLEPGGPAGFVWLGEDPVEQPATLAQPQGVYLGRTWSQDATPHSPENTACHELSPPPP